ncbi:hypothetical protein C5167_042598 [Papaver somniferum]|uniref:Uncharacterized protein n=1 Tax=Papaver somniferum TaxID=3469 RepID=A0A4Y7L765_PAPSO|nr:hypothetical protein C5167_042598 [Papaver somniferum]
MESRMLSEQAFTL